MFKQEVECLVLPGVLDLENGSEWWTQYFAQPKHKSYLVRFLIDFRNLNQQLKQTPYPMPKTNDILFKIR